MTRWRATLLGLRLKRRSSAEGSDKPVSNEAQCSYHKAPARTTKHSATTTNKAGFPELSFTKGESGKNFSYKMNRFAISGYLLTQKME